MNATEENEAVSRSSGANLARNAPGPRDIGDGSDLKRPYQILRVSPTKKRGTVFAHVIVQFGPAWVRYRVVKTPQGLRVFPPSNPCPGPGGKMFYKRSAGVDDVELRERLQDDILKALEAHLREDGRRLPKPLPKTRRRNRVREALLAVADEVDPLSAGRQLVSRVNEVLGDPAATDREILAGARILAQILDIDSRRLSAAVSTVDMELRARAG
jgi:hypothetical protein